MAKIMLNGVNYSAAVEETALLNKIYPVGSIYMSVNSTDPGTLFGGTWVRWGNGKVPVGVNSSETEFNAAEKTGGEKTHTLTAAEMPSHAHYINQNSLATSSAGNHRHGLKYISDNTHTGAGQRIMSTGANSSATPCEYAGDHAHTVTFPGQNTNSTGSGAAHNNLQPYITCYMWKRTA